MSVVEVIKSIELPVTERLTFCDELHAIVESELTIIELNSELTIVESELTIIVIFLLFLTFYYF